MRDVFNEFNTLKVIYPRHLVHIHRITATYYGIPAKVFKPKDIICVEPNLPHAVLHAVLHRAESRSVKP